MAGPGHGSGKVWELQRDDGGFSPFPPQDSAIIEADYSVNSRFCNVSGHGKLDFRRMVLVQKGSHRERNVRCSVITLPRSPSITSYWTWNEKGSTFVLYSIDAIIDIELAYLHYCGSSSTCAWLSSSTTVNLSMCSSRLPYTIDFSTMMQTRHGYGTQRAVQRQSLPPGQSLQSLLCQPPTSLIGGPPSISSASPSCVISSPGTSSGAVASGKSGSGFSLACGPATSSMLKYGTSTGVGSTSIAPVTDLTSGSAATAVTSGKSHKPVTRRGRGKKSSSSSSSPPFGRKGKAESAGADAGVPEYASLEKTLKPADDGPCPICMCELSEQSGYEEGSVAMPTVPYAPPVDLCKLRKCGHMMHRACLLMMLKSETSKNGLTCPTCKKVYGMKTGDMPDGTMNVRHTRHSLPGYERYGTIEIVYNFSPRIYKGRHYKANGFPRTCYLPDSPKGQKVLRLLHVAWERRLTFTIGTSVTTGATDTVVWNEIHHKTESSSNHSGHGYPDPNYLDNVLMELSLQGVEDSDTTSTSSSDDSL